MSVVYVPEQEGKPSPSPNHIQKMLDENNKMMQAVVEFQNMGRAAECHQLFQVLHRNMIFLASIADAVPSLLPPHAIQINMPSKNQQIPASTDPALIQDLQTQPSNEILNQSQIILPNEGLSESGGSIPGIAPVFVSADKALGVQPDPIILSNEGLTESEGSIPGIAPVSVSVDKAYVAQLDQVMVPSQEVNENQPHESDVPEAFEIILQPVGHEVQDSQPHESAVSQTFDVLLQPTGQEINENQHLESCIPQTFDVLLQPTCQDVNGSQSQESGIPQTFDVLLQPASQEINGNQPCESGVAQTFDVILQPPTGLS